MLAKCFIIYNDCSPHSAVNVNNKILANVPAGIGASRCQEVSAVGFMTL